MTASILTAATVLDHLVASPCCLPRMGLEEILTAYAELGFRKFEAFTSWCASALDLDADPRAYRALAERFGLQFASMHLPPVGDDLDISRALAGARFARDLGARVVLFKAKTRAAYVRAGGCFLDAIEAEGLGVTGVLQNHAGTAISSLDDYREVLAGIGDPRMKAVLEVGHFHRAGVHWRDACELLRGRIALVHVNDIAAGRSVPYGTGEVDFAGLMAHLGEIGYTGDVVVELELETRDTDPQRTLRCLREAVEHLRACSEETP